jgi:hypothetical protein
VRCPYLCDEFIIGMFLLIFLQLLHERGVIGLHLLTQVSGYTTTSHEHISTQKRTVKNRSKRTEAREFMAMGGEAM